ACKNMGIVMLQLVDRATQFVNSMDNSLSIKRNKNHKIQTYLEKVLPKIKSFEFSIIHPDDMGKMRSAVEKVLPDWAEGLEKKLFIDDMMELCELFKEITITKMLNVKLQVVKDNMCRLFHEDNNHQRLLCTYLGSGTEWIEDSFVNRKRLGKGDNRRVIQDWDKVQHAENFEVIVLRGKLFAGIKKGAVHRSPPLKSPKDYRVLLKMDEI
ncbi:MAG: DUF1826 domain-containing protein, partial [Bdellovibrionota bacterium]|nr:DUF1826 domain-containing protein [Bdellovibrionota bacterium]